MKQAIYISGSKLRGKFLCKLSKNFVRVHV